MSTIIYILLLVGLMIFMSKMGMGCCGGHSGNTGHGNGGGGGCHGGSRQNSDSGAVNTQNGSAEGNDVEMVHDPVCEMYVSKQNAYRKSINGQEYFFCSEACRDKFNGQQ